MNEKVKLHLELIQQNIQRFAQNSFTCRSWAITLLAAAFAIAQDSAREQVILFMVLPVVSFWYLDAYYLKTERLFRCMYDKVRTQTTSDLNMSTKAFESNSQNCIRIMFSKSKLPIYLPMLAIIAYYAWCN